MYEKFKARLDAGKPKLIRTKGGRYAIPGFSNRFNTSTIFIDIWHFSITKLFFDTEIMTSSSTIFRGYHLHSKNLWSENIKQKTHSLSNSVSTLIIGYFLQALT